MMRWCTAHCGNKQMDNKLKFIVVGLVVMLAASLFVAFQNFSEKEKLEIEKDRLKDENAQLLEKINKVENALSGKEGKIKALNAEIGRITQEKKEIERRYEVARKNQEQMARSLKDQQASRTKIAKDKTNLETELKKLRKDFDSLKVIKEQLEEEVNALEWDMDDLRHDRGELDQQLGYVQQEGERLAAMVGTPEIVAPPETARPKTQGTETPGSSVELPPIIVRPKTRSSFQSLESNPAVATRTRSSGTPTSRAIIRRTVGDTAAASTGKTTTATAPRALTSRDIPELEAAPALRQGKVLSVIKKNNFVVIDMGEESGVEAGDTFGVYRKGKKIATIETIRTAKSVAACDIKQGSTILAGDIVK